MAYTNLGDQQYECKLEMDPYLELWVQPFGWYWVVREGCANSPPPLSTFSACYSLTRCSWLLISFPTLNSCLNFSLLLASAPLFPTPFQHPPSTPSAYFWGVVWAFIAPGAVLNSVAVTWILADGTYCSALHLPSRTVIATWVSRISGGLWG